MVVEGTETSLTGVSRSQSSKCLSVFITEEGRTMLRKRVLLVALLAASSSGCISFRFGTDAAPPAFEMKG